MTETMGGNAGEALRSYSERLTVLLDEIAERQEEVKEIRAEAKAAGFNVRVLNKALQELRRGPEYREAQLQLELELDTYRAALDLPRSLEEAQGAVRSAAEVVPEPKARRKRGGAA